MKRGRKRGYAKAQILHLRIAILDDREYNRLDHKHNHACWSPDTHTILLRRSRRGIEQLSDLLHETVHFWVDDIHPDAI